MMTSRVSNIRKKRIGRPPVNAVPVMVRIPPAEIEPIDGWISRQKEPVSRPEAIRRLVEVALQRKSYKEKIERIARCLEKGDVDGALLAVGLNPAEFENPKKKSKGKKDARPKTSAR